jgi:hypothetical protein
MLQQFLDVYKEMVRHHCSVRTEKCVEELGMGYRRKTQTAIENGGAADGGGHADQARPMMVGTGAGQQATATEQRQESLEEFCLGWLMKQPQVDCVLNGITKERYARTALSLLHRLSDRPTSVITTPAGSGLSS